jgi:UDP-3-O-[3-hydroxymyristoyl] glucosamine N-acyltransferase
MYFARYCKNFVIDMFTFTRVEIGRMTREVGLDLDRRGSIQIKDIAFMEPLNRHRNILAINGVTPIISSSAYVAPNATVYADVFIAHDSYIGFGAVVQGYANPVRIGFNTKVGDNATLLTADFVPDDAFPASLTIGNNVNIEHSCHLFSSIVDDNVHIGFRTVVM